MIQLPRIRPSVVLISAVALGLLAGMMLTNPDYNSVVRPFEVRVPPGASGQTRLIGGRITGWRTADTITLPAAGGGQQRDTQGVFLVVDLTLFGTTESTMIRAAWIGTSGRRYDTTARASGVLRQIEDVWLQPGLESRATAVFELPPDEVAQGAILLSLRTDPPLDGTLRLAAPLEAPAHAANIGLEG